MVLSAVMAWLSLSAISNGSSSTRLRTTASGGPGFFAERAKTKTAESGAICFVKAGSSDTFNFKPVASLALGGLAVVLPEPVDPAAAVLIRES